MNVIPFVHEGLGNSSYLVGLDDEQALLVDPDRTVLRYLTAAEARGWNVEAVLETHLHADFVSGAREVAAAAGARLFIPREADSRLPHEPVDHGKSFEWNGVELTAVASPGHTPEHIAYIARAAAGPPLLFSGGSLIVGGAARTDLISPDMTETLTRAQFETLKTAFTDLPGETLLYPTHGGGSFCSAGAGGERTSTLAAERAGNPLMSFEDEDEFVRWFPTTFPGTPAYYFRMRAFNRAGPRLRREIVAPRRLSPAEFDEARRTATIIDTRPVAAYSAAHIEGSLHIPFRDSFAVWLGWLVPPDSRLLFVAAVETLGPVVDEALLVGYESFGGWLSGDIEGWAASGRDVRSVDYVSGEAARSLLAEGARVIDVREPDEFAGGHLPGAVHMPLGQLPMRDLNGMKDAPVVVYCGHGERASTAASILEGRGYRHITNVDGGYDAMNGAVRGAR
jgi:glyoxylase-like metal-dependent hydrolase (beta-lactamase superfamily II)